MKNLNILLSSFVVSILLIFGLFFSPTLASAHCDTLDGPVVTAARKAMKTGNVNYILIWVKPENEDEIRKALKTAKTKKKSAKTKKGKDKAEMELFETLVRIHREGEGAKYEGIKPAGSIEHEIVLADKAVETGKLNDVLNNIKSSENKEIILHLFHKVKEKSHYDLDDVPAGREFIEAYVVFIHSVEKAIKGTDLDEHTPHQH
jgi:YesN/AraC family two-component response regulator